MNSLINLTFERTAPCCAAVVWWNYWDHEHLGTVHEKYRAENNNDPIIFFGDNGLCNHCMLD